MRVLLIGLFNHSMKWTPLNLLYLAGVLVYNGIECTIADENIIGRAAVLKEIHKAYNIVGLSVLSNTRWDAFDMAQRVRKLSPGSRIVMGGVHASVMPKQCEKYADVVIKGDGEAPFFDVCLGREPTEKILPIDDIPSPAWHLIDLHSYPGKGFTTYDPRWFNSVNLKREPRISVMSSRSCISKCNFCSSWWVQGKYRMRDPILLADEINALYDLYKIKSFYFIDDSFYLDKAYCVKFCDEIVQRKMKIAFRIQTRADAIDEEYAHALRKAGCYIVAIGVETGSAKIMEQMNKGIDIEAARNAIKICKKEGIRTEALLIVGNVGETDVTIEETRQFLRETKPFAVSAAEEGLILLPGTKVYREVLRQNMITDDFWDTRIPAKSYKYTPEQIDKWRERVLGYNLRTNVRRKINKICSNLRSEFHGRYVDEFACDARFEG